MKKSLSYKDYEKGQKDWSDQKKDWDDQKMIDLSIKGNQVVVVDVKMPFWSMVTFMVKWAIAAIPALFILFLIFSVLGVIFAGFK